MSTPKKVKPVILRRSSSRVLPPATIYLLQSHNYKIFTSIGLHPRTLSPTPTILDIGAGPNFINESALPPEWHDVEIPQSGIAKVRSATGNRLRICGAIALYVQVGA